MEQRRTASNDVCSGTYKREREREIDTVVPTDHTYSALWGPLISKIFNDTCRQKATTYCKTRIVWPLNYRNGQASAERRKDEEDEEEEEEVKAKTQTKPIAYHNNN